MRRLLFSSLLPLVIIASIENNAPILEEITTPYGYARFVRAQLEKEPLVTKACVQHMLRFVSDLLKLQLWAIEMFDAGAKLPSGLLRGHGAALGTFDECINIKSDYSEELGITYGKYCLGSFLLANLTDSAIPIPIVYPETRLLSYKEATVTLPWGVCVPSVCTAKDVQTIHLSILKFKEETCQTKESQTRELDDGDVAALAVICTIVGLVMLSTAYDITHYYWRGGYGSDLLRTFSLVTNGLKIITVKEDPAQVKVLHGLRTFSMLTLMGGLRYILFVFAPLHNWLDILKWVTDTSNAPILELIICVDTFLLVSGFLISYQYLQASKNGESFNILIYYMRRIIRLTPALGVLILVDATLLRHVGSGPVWPHIRDQWLVNNCREYWWSSLLYIQNYINPVFSDICVLTTWHLSVDMQLFILSPILLVLLKRWSKVTLYLVGFLFGCSVISVFLSGWVYEIKAVLVMLKSLKDVDNYMAHYYFPTHTRAGPWLIGFILGYFVFKTMTSTERTLFRKEIKSKLVVCLLWILSLGLLLLCILITLIYAKNDYDWVSHSALLAFIRPLWSIALCWIIFSCVIGSGGPINWMLSSTVSIVLSRISYSTYLVYWTIMFFFTYQTRLGLEFNHLDAMYRISADLAISILVGFVWTLLFESPLISLTKVILDKRRGTHQRNSGTMEFKNIPLENKSD